MKNDETLLEKLKHYNKTHAPFHMPGHKRNSSLAPYLQSLCADCDITEIDGFDNLHEANGVLLSSMERAARLWQSKKTFFLVNGSTCGILAAVHSVVHTGDTVLLARNCHKSVYHAMELCGVHPVFLMPEPERKTQAMGCVSPESVRLALHQNSQVKLIILTSPTYEGFVSNIEAICEIAHEKNIPVLIDEAHGAHLGFGFGFPNGAVKSGADIVIQSLHKTLPSLTQTAIAHLCSNRIDIDKFARSLSIFETSSPSYLLLSSIDSCIKLLECKGDSLFAAWEKNLNTFYMQAKHLKNIQVLCFEDSENIYAFDPSKIILSTNRCSFSGQELMEILRCEKIECEMASLQYVIAMTGMGDTEQSLVMLLKALQKADEYCKPAKKESEKLYTPLLECVIPVARAMQAESEAVLLEKSIGKISAEYVWAYPPGIPLLIPGEKINGELIHTLASYTINKINLHSTSGLLPNKIIVNKSTFMP